MSFLEAARITGNAVSGGTHLGLKWLDKLGFFSSATTARVVTILFLLVIAFVCWKMLGTVRAVIKWGVIIFLALLIIAVGASLV